MIDPISRSRSTPEQMRARIRAIEAELQGLSIDELMRGGRELRRQQSVSRGDAGRYDPNQPRVPAGNSDGGQWTDGESGGRAINDPRIVSDATPDNLWIPGADYAAVGHHIPPRAIWRHLPLQPETRRVLDEAVSGPLGIKLVNPVTGRTREHRWDREHQEYNQAVGELFKMYLDGLGLTALRQSS
jgi:hypothetical protein